MNSPNIPGFTRHSRRYRVLVSLDEADARAIAAEAEATAASPGAVVRSIVRGWRIGREKVGVPLVESRDVPDELITLVNMGRALDAVRGGEP